MKDRALNESGRQAPSRTLVKLTHEPIPTNDLIHVNGGKMEGGNLQRRDMKHHVLYIFSLNSYVLLEGVWKVVVLALRVCAVHVEADLVGYVCARECKGAWIASMCGRARVHGCVDYGYLRARESARVRGLQVRAGAQHDYKNVFPRLSFFLQGLSVTTRID